MMNSGTGRMRRIAASFTQSSSTFETFVCSSCRRQQHPSIARNTTIRSASRRSYAITASAPIKDVTETSTSQLTIPVAAANPGPKYIIRAGVLLSRAPLLTPPQTPFESAFYLYQRRLNERLVLPFPQYFYFKKGTPAYEEWKSRRRERGGVATRDVGKYNAYANEAWNDELLVGDEESNPSTVVRKLVEEEGKDKIPSDEDLKDSSKPLHGLRRITAADRKNYTKSLERALDRTLYLLVKKQIPGKEQGDGLWQLPSGEVQASEGLREAAERSLEASCGPNLNTWFVANHPVGHYIFNRRLNSKAPDTASPSPTPSPSDNEDHVLGEKSFYLKARLLAGQADISSNTMDVLDYQWLAKNEIEKVVTPLYWSSLKNMLAER